MPEDKAIQEKPKHSHPILQGMEMALPVVLGYIAVGFAYGVLARKAGLSLLQSVLMSVIVYAGSAQLISVGLFAVGVQPLSIILTTFIVNIRHLLMSAALAPYFEKWRNIEKVAFGLDFALPAMFIALLVMQIKDYSHIVVAVTAGLLALLLYVNGIDQWHVLIAASLAAGLGVLLWQPIQE